MLEESKLLLSDRFSAASQTLLARNMEATQNEASGWGVPPANKSPATQKIPHAHVSKTIPAPSGKTAFTGLGNAPYVQARTMLYILIKSVNRKISDIFHLKKKVPLASSLPK